MCYGYYCVILKLRIQQLLDLLLGPQIDTRCGLIQKQDLALLQKCSCKTYQLFLTRTKIPTILNDLGVKTLSLVKGFLHPNFLKNVPKLFIG